MRAASRASRFVHAGDQHGIRVSFEFFPPKTAEMEARLWEVVQRLEPLAPRFVSVTYGAGGSTRERTHATVRRIRQETALEPAAHLTCVAATRDEIDAVAHEYWEAGIRHLVEKVLDFRGRHFSVIVVVEVAMNTSLVAAIGQIQLHAQRNVQFKGLSGHFPD